MIKNSWRRVHRTTLFEMLRAVDLRAEGTYNTTWIDSSDIRRLFYLMAGIAFLRGTDYLWANRDLPLSPSLSLTESVAQLPAWGFAYMLSSIVLVWAVKFEKVVPSALAHAVLVLLYGMTTIITMQTTIPVLDGYRGVGPLLLLAYLHYRGIVMLGFPFRQDHKGRNNGQHAREGK